MEPEMKTIPADEPVLVDDIAVMTYNESRVMSQYWRAGESLWKGVMPCNSFQLLHENSIRQTVFGYFVNQCFRCSVDEIADDDITVNNYWLEILPKILWLCEEWLTKKQFVEPLMAHWNPRIQKNVVHPGMSRASVMHLFPQGLTEFSVVYFNTGGGYDRNTMNKLRKITIDDLIDDGWNTMTFVADHESLIPHFSKNIEANANYKKDYHRKIIERLSSMSIETNTKDTIFTDPLSAWIKRNGNVQIIFTDQEPGPLAQARALLCALLGKTYTDHEVKVSCN